MAETIGGKLPPRGSFPWGSKPRSKPR